MFEPAAWTEDKQGSSRSQGGSVRQRTLKNPISCTGVALHSGLKVTMSLKPAQANTGIVFKRIDIAGGGAEIPALWSHVDDTRLCTGLSNGNGVVVRTVEHLMAALAGQRIDNAVIEINGPEVPVMDGSAAPFVFLIDCAGVVEQEVARKAIRVLKKVEMADGDRMVSLLPGPGFSLSFAFDIAYGGSDRQELSVALTTRSFKAEVCRARTFGFEHEVAALRAAGLAKGGSLDNAVVVSVDNKVLNEDGLRYEDEFVRHKILDAVGDLYLAGLPILGQFRGLRSGHALNNKLLRALFADPEAFEIVPMIESQAIMVEPQQASQPRAAVA
jgi:UDP-3-O-[3-hydroxymyristoyl] N-acetylglucosamine deacetylase